jgi:hypothetical protein
MYVDSLGNVASEDANWEGIETTYQLKVKKLKRR